MTFEAKRGYPLRLGEEARLARDLPQVVCEYDDPQDNEHQAGGIPRLPEHVPVVADEVRSPTREESEGKEGDIIPME